MIWLRTILLVGIVIFFNRLVIENINFNIAKIISFILVSIVGVALLCIPIDALELYFPFFIIVVLLGSKVSESIILTQRRDDK